MPNKGCGETSLLLSSEDELARKRKETMLMKAKSKSMNSERVESGGGGSGCGGGDDDDDDDDGGEKTNATGKCDVNRTFSDKKNYNGNKSQKMKMKIKRQASLEEKFPGVGGSDKETEESLKKETEEKDGGRIPSAEHAADEVSKNQERKYQFLEDLKVPKIEIMRKNGVSESLKGLKEYGIISPNSSKLRERFSRSKILKQDSKNLSVELSKSSDSGIGVSRSTEDESVKTSESVIFRFFDIGPDTRLNKSDSERSPNFLDTVSLFTRSRSHERSVSSDSSDKNLSDIDKPSIKIRKRQEYSESRDSSSSYEGSIFDAHISNRVRKLHEVALKQMSEESARKLENQKRAVDFKYSVEFGSYDSIPVGKTQSLTKVRKFKSLERTDSAVRGSHHAKSEHDEEDCGRATGENLGKNKTRLKKQERLDKKVTMKDKRNNFSRESSLSTERKKEKRLRGFLKNRNSSNNSSGGGGGSGSINKDAREEESDDNVDVVDGSPDPRDNNNKDPKVKDEMSMQKRLSRKDKKSLKKPKRALSEEHCRSRREKSLLFSITGGKRRSDSETRHGKFFF